MDEKEIALLIIVPTVTFIFISIGIVFLIYTYFKTKQKHLFEKQQAEFLFSRELNRTKLEMQNETLTIIGRELHDNIGQLLTVSKIHAHSLLKINIEDKKLIALDDALDKTIIEVKALSKSLDASRINNFGLKNEIENEVERLNKLQVAQLTLSFTGENNLTSDRAIMLFRILQEFLSNSIKYSRCKTILIDLLFSNESLTISIKDDGKGFDRQQKANGSGLLNMEKRANFLLATNFSFDSSPNNGTSISFTLQNN